MVERRQLGRGSAALRFIDEWDEGFGWLDDGDTMRRSSHALVVGEDVWVVDPVDADGVEELVRAAGQPAGVVQLLDRHERDCAALAKRLGVPHHVVPFGEIAGVPFRFVRVMNVPKWREAALWWPGPRVLVCADALGTVPYFRARGEPIGVHPFLRPWPPKRLAALDPERVLVGHGEGVSEGATEAVRRAIRTSRRGLPSALANALRRR